MIIDCFTFFNELDLLEVRLAEMSPAVDKFVLAEAPFTFQGQPKPLIFAENRPRFRRFLSRINHTIVEDIPTRTDAWSRERHQRNALRRALAEVPPDATILISDVDEILRPSAIIEASRRQAFCFFELDLRLYYLDLRSVPWIKAYAAPKYYIDAMEDLTTPRFEERDYLRAQGMNPEMHELADAGWHLSWTGGIDRILTKLNAFSHTEPEFARWKDDQRLREAMSKERFFLDGRALTPVSLTLLPRTVRRHLSRYMRLGLIAQTPSWRQRLAIQLQAAFK